MASVTEIIRQHQAEIIAHWSAEAATAASARGLPAPALVNVLPQFLVSLADDLENQQLGAPAHRHEHVLSHLTTRVRQGFELAEINDEFNVLERCVADTWANLRDEDRPAQADIDRMRQHIQDAMMRLTEAFFLHMFEDEQAEKRYTRMLSDIANTALHADRRPLRERLNELLAVVVEAMAARTAVFVLFDSQRHRVLTVAGSGDETFESYASSLDPTSFTTTVSGSEVATSIYDVTTTKLDVPDSLRASGVHSVLGIRIPRASGIVGVLYVGVTETREFTSREIQRLELLGDRISLHLENAQLFADLHETIDALHDERGLRERFVAILAHDLRGPLSTARLAVELLEREPSTRDVRQELTHKIGRSIDRVDRMIRDLLDASRIRAGEPLPLRLADCDLCALAHEVAEEARAMHGDRFAVECSAVRGIWSIDELQRALWNLVTNAVKYGAAQQQITIRVESTDETARVSVHNFGEPIPAEEVASLFDAFRRASTADAADRVGWGLGLALVRGCAEAHGGHVEVTSDQNGTTFVIELPFDATPYQPSAASSREMTVH